MPEFPKLSNKAVLKSTGRTWPEWFSSLTKEGATSLSHKEIVKLLTDKFGLENQWWCQNVTNTYEKHIGRRKLGQSQNNDFSVGVQRTLNTKLEDLWKLIVSQSGLEILLGDSTEIEVAPSRKYTLSDKTKIEFRVVLKERRIRLFYHPPSLPIGTKPTVLQINISSKKAQKNTKCVLSILHEGLASEEIRKEQQKLWQNRLLLLQKLTN